MSRIKSIQRGRFDSSATSYASKKITISKVDPSKCVVIPSSAGLYYPCMSYGNLTETELTVYVGSSNGSGITFGWQVIEFY